MLNKTMRKRVKAVILFVGAALTLFAANAFYLNNHNPFLEVEQQKINMVITKDLSRLGRDYIDTGYYLERYFPTKNVRYIAISDGIDTYQNNGNNDISPFKSVINDMYAKDISKKIRAVMDTKRTNGEFIGAFAPYGYFKNPENWI